MGQTLSSTEVGYVRDNIGKICLAASFLRLLGPKSSADVMVDRGMNLEALFKSPDRKFVESDVVDFFF